MRAEFEVNRISNLKEKYVGTVTIEGSPELVDKIRKYCEKEFNMVD
jgi:hypothetical protein